GIPQYRLPRDILDREIQEVEGVGVEIRTNSPVSSLEDLFKQGYSAVFLALGAQQGAKVGIAGEDLALEAVSFLRQVNLGQSVTVGEKVAVVGGGHAAIDAARTALRLGAKEVTILYRRTRQEMRAIPEEIAEAEEEGVRVELLIAPTRLAQGDGGLRLSCVRMKLGDFDASGRRRPEPMPETEAIWNFDTVILAVGQLPEIPPALGLTMGRRNTLEADADTLATSLSGVFAGGDCVSGPSTVINAIAAGRKAASSIDRFLGGKGNIDESLLPEEVGARPVFVVDEGEKPRVPVPELSPGERQGFISTELGYTTSQAVEEGQRCLCCDLEPRLEVE
ncbi:MAG: FAD-dependent oxidoreductase, partial [Chloroflexota bacterium]